MTDTPIKTDTPINAIFSQGPLLLVGAGKMGGAMLKGLLGQGLSPTRVRVQDPAPPSDISAQLYSAGLKPEAPPLRLEAPPSVILLAVKPQVMDAVLPSVADQVGANTLVMSVAAGKPISLYQAAFPEGTAIIRAMPNTPAAIGKGVTGVIGNTEVNEQHRGLCSAILKTLGDVVWLENEDQMDALTAVSGSGPAYVFHLVEAMTRAGVAAGLPETMAIDLARQTVTGASALLEAEAQTGADQLRKNVTSPGGTTEAALNVLMQTPGGLSDLMTEAIQAAAARSRELSKD